MSVSPDAWKGIAMAGLLVAVFANVIREGRLRARRHAQAHADFRRWLASPQAHAMGLSPDDCVVVLEQVPDRRQPAISYSLTLYLRNAAGGHVLYLSQASGPFVKAMTPEAAKAVLKGRFRA